MTVITIRNIGDSLGVELPGEVLSRLGLKAGDALSLTESDDGALRIARVDVAHESQMALAREGMRDYAEALRELAK